MTTVRPLRLADAPACDAIIASLPYFFGAPAGIDECAQAARTQEGFVAEDDGRLTGFLTFDWMNRTSVEVTWMAVDSSHRRGGRGRMLIERLASEAHPRGARLLHLFTSASPDAQGEVDGYDGTRRFYEAMGFVALRQLELRDWTEPALLLVRPLP